MFLNEANIRYRACSAHEAAFAVEEEEMLETTTPHSVAVGMSTASTPTPYWMMSSKLGAAWMVEASRVHISGTATWALERWRARDWRSAWTTATFLVDLWMASEEKT